MTTPNTNTPSCLSMTTANGAPSQTDWTFNPVELSAQVLAAIPADTSASATLSMAAAGSNTEYSLFYSPSANSISVCKQSTGTILEATSTINIDEPLDTMDVFYLGGLPYLSTYASDSSYLNLYRINEDFTLRQVRNQYVGSGFTMMHVLPYRDTSCVVLYNGTTGDCVKYQISVPPYDGLSLTQVWSDSWAKTWGHFTFFGFGGENFFLKINQQHEKVNIDHFMDDPDEGSHPVLSKNASHSLLNAAAISGFQGSEGQAYFLIYQSDGSLSLNSIYPNCLGWWSLGSTQTADNAKTLHTMTIANTPYLLLLN